MKSTKKVIILLLLSGFTLQGSLYAQSDFQKLAVTLQKTDGETQVYYPEGYKKTAESLQELLQKAIKYYDEKLGIYIPVAIILFTPEETRKLGEIMNQPIQYNQFLPFVNVGNPNEMCIPVGRGSAVDSLILAISKLSPSLQNLQLSSTEISDRFLALLGFHELGHLYMNELEINQPVGWYEEMMANYIAYAFIKEMSPSDAQLWELMNEAFVTYLNPGRSLLLNDMGRSGTESYVWMQGNLTLKADEVFQSQGLDFLQQLKRLRNVKIFNDDLSMLLALDQIAPGLKQWADKEHLISEENKIKMDSIESIVKRQTLEALQANMPNPFTLDYSYDWQIGDIKYKEIAMEVIKEWENDDFTNTDIFANYLIVNFLDANGFYDKNSMLDKFKKDRANYINPKIKLNSVISLKSTDQNEKWVMASGNLINNIPGTKQENIDFIELFKINRYDKIDLLKFYRIQ